MPDPYKGGRRIAYQGRDRQDRQIASARFPARCPRCRVPRCGIRQIAPAPEPEPRPHSFRNPGTLRVPAEHALQGGESDCRNRTLHQLFLQLGLGERAGSGLPKIRHAWESLGYTVTITESFEPYDQSVLEVTKIAVPVQVVELGAGKVSGKVSGKILDMLAAEPCTTIPELAVSLGVANRTIERNLGSLQESGRLRRVGPAKGGHWEVLK
ncbi:MAG TPA: ATP-binding protein [Fibrobacteria bacterium]|nr:ATP-binding protein [Fibrobacteria bacterium]